LFHVQETAPVVSHWKLGLPRAWCIYSRSTITVASPFMYVQEGSVDLTIVSVVEVSCGS